jgi:hypothetical protein
LIPIYLNSEGQGLDFDTFNAQLLDICREHQAQRRALAFAFILYDFDNPHVAKILHDGEYWQALNKTSGKWLTVFSINYRKPLTELTQTGFMTTPLTEISPSGKTNSLIAKYFGPNIQVSYPAILFFQVKGKKMIDSLLVDLHQEDIEPAFRESQVYIFRAVEALKRITPANVRHSTKRFLIA